MVKSTHISRMTMMTTMTTSPEIELAGNEQLELQLGDEHIDTSAPVDTPENPLTASEPISLPAALCDDKLLEEINSIPDKMGFKIGDVADMLGIKQYVLRYWETEFDLLKPKKASNNQRMYTRKDVENAFLIRKLLYRDKFSIEGARQALKDVKFALRKEKEHSKDMIQVVQKMDQMTTLVRQFVDDIRKTKAMLN